MSKASKPAKQSGTQLADTIRASSLKTTASTGRTQDCTRPSRQNIKSGLATREPSTQDLWQNTLACLYRSLDFKMATADETTYRPSQIRKPTAHLQNFDALAGWDRLNDVGVAPEISGASRLNARYHPSVRRRLWLIDATCTGHKRSHERDAKMQGCLAFDH